MIINFMLFSIILRLQPLNKSKRETEEQQILKKKRILEWRNTFYVRFSCFADAWHFLLL
jgi:hypothetical protein